MSATSSLRRRIDMDPSMAVLAVGDLLAVLVFVVVGQISHGIDPVARPGHVLGTALPFLIGLATVGVLGGLYTRDAIHSPKRVAALLVPAWIVAVAIAQLFRATEFFPGNAALTFALVSVAVGGALLLLWRIVASMTL